MSRKCQVTGKKTSVGKSITRRGIAKKKKGIGLNTTGITKRKFLPNLQKKRFWFEEENRFVELKLSTKAIRTITKKGLCAVISQMRKERNSV